MLEVGQLKLKTPDWMDISADGLAKVGHCTGPCCRDDVAIQGLFLRFAIYHGTVAVCPWVRFSPCADHLYVFEGSAEILAFRRTLLLVTF